MYRNTNATTSNTIFQTAEAGRKGSGAGSTTAGAEAGHLPKTKTANGANKSMPIAPCTKMALIMPGANLLERKKIESIWLVTVEMPYIPTNIAAANGQPRQLDRRIR